MRREAGFSLIEMMVVLAIISLAAGLVVVNAPGPSTNLAQETDQLIRSLVAARDLALIKNRTVMVEVSEAGYDTRVSSRLGAIQSVEMTRWSNGTTVAAADGRLPSIILFDPVGLVEPASFTLFNGEAQDGIVIDQSGRIARLSDDSQN